MTFHMPSFVLLVDIAHMWVTCTVVIGEATGPIVRRANTESLQSSDHAELAEIDVHGQLSTPAHYRKEAGMTATIVDAMSIHAKAAMLANDPRMHVHLSAEDRERLGLHPDIDLPRRDALLQDHAVIVRQKETSNSTSAKEISLPLSLLQQVSVQNHRGSDGSEPPNSHKLADESGERFHLPEPHKTNGKVQVPRWVPKNAFAEDGTLIMDRVFFSAAIPRRKRPDWAVAGLATESSAEAFESEMTRLGREDDVENSLAAMEMDVTENSFEEPKYDDKTAFRFYKFTPIKLRHIQSADMVQIAEIRCWSYGYELPMHQASVGWNELGRSPLGHEAMMVRDGNWQTTWQDIHMGSMLIAFGAPFTLTGFMFITAMDSPQDDPVQWYFEGANNPVEGPWTMLHAQLSDGNVPPQRTAQTEKFTWKVDCAISDWHDWSECSENCSGGNRTRVRKIMRHSWNNGQCEHEFDQLGYCNEEPCDKVIVKSGITRGISFDGMFSLLIASVALVFGSQIIDV